MKRRDKMIQEKEHDPYRKDRKPKEVTTCTTCGLVFREGRWREGAAPADAFRGLCPACERARDGYPAGFVSISGSFWPGHRQEIESLCRNMAEAQRGEHPLNRILEIQEQDDALLVTTTTIHLARSLGEHLHAAYAGELEIQNDEDVVRVTWQR